MLWCKLGWLQSWVSGSAPNQREVVLSLQVAAGEAVTPGYVILESSQDVEPQKPEPFCLRMSPFFCNLGPNAAEFDLFSFDLFLPLHSVYQERMKIKVCSF